MRWDPLRAITRRALWINYRSPMICVEQVIESGSGSVDSSLLEIEPTFRLAGPVLSGAVVGADIALTWTEVPTAFAYVVYRATVAEGPFVIQAAGVIDLFYTDLAPTPGQTYFYKVTGIEPNYGETEASNVISFTI